jgi:TRAP-type mannitol/chloroaromatic compound transport system permease small subunit
VHGILGERGLVGRVSTWVALAGAIGVLLIAAIVVVDVLMRALFDHPILAVDDLNPFNIAVAIAAFFPLCMVGRHFVTIRFLGRGLGPRAHLLLEVFGALATLLVFALYGWQLMRYAWNVTNNGLASGILEVPQAPWWWIVALILAFSVLVQAAVVVDCIRALSAGDMKGQDGATDHGA